MLLLLLQDCHLVEGQLAGSCHQPPCCISQLDMGLICLHCTQFIGTTWMMGPWARVHSTGLEILEAGPQLQRSLIGAKPFGQNSVAFLCLDQHMVAGSYIDPS